MMVVSRGPQASDVSPQRRLGLPQAVGRHSLKQNLRATATESSPWVMALRRASMQSWQCGLGRTETPLAPCRGCRGGKEKD